MSSPPEQPGTGGYGQQPTDPGGYGTPLPRYSSGGGGYGEPAPQQPSKVPLVLSIVGIICWFVFSPAAIVLGLVAQNRYRKEGQRDTLAKVAWIGGIVVLVLGIVLAVVRAKSGHTTNG
jgi:preprotein translocase subunit SecG